MKILAVDDSRLVLKIIGAAIECLGYQPVTAGNGKQALEVMEREGRDVALILLDWNMPVMDGYATLKALKKDPRWAPIPVMMVTTEGERASIVKAVQAGAQHYLTKPFSNQELMVRMAECLGMGE